MFFKIIIGLLIFFVYNVHLIELGVKTADNYGPYQVTFTKNVACHGPKSKDLTSVTMELVIIDNSQICTFNVTVPEPARIEEVKITVFSVKGNRKYLLYNYKVPKPCEHFAIAATIETLLHTKNCLVKKGNYTFVLNFTEYTKSFFGTSFFYGEYEFKSVTLSSKGNIMCMIGNAVFKKLP